jgi:hypothetical protein
LRFGEAAAAGKNVETERDLNFPEAEKKGLEMEMFLVYLFLTGNKATDSNMKMPRVWSTKELHEEL